jgi:hypothetical protein
MDSLVVFLLSFSPFFFLSRFSFFCQFLPTRSSPFSLPLSSCLAFTQGLNSLSLSLSLTHTHVQRGTLCWFGLSFRWEGGRKEKHATAADNFRKRKRARACNSFWEEWPPLSPCIYSHNKCAGVFGRWTKVVLIPLLGHLGLTSILILP